MTSHARAYECAACAEGCHRDGCLLPTCSWCGGDSSWPPAREAWPGGDASRNAPEPSPRGSRKKIGKTPRLKGEVAISEVERLFPDAKVQQAQDRYDMWHGEQAQHALHWQVDDGKPGVTRKLVVAQGVVPKALYQVPWDGSSKGTSLWEHEFVEGKEPIRAIDPETNVTLELPTNPKAVADSFLREGGPGSDY